MKIVIVGATGVLGSAVTEALKSRHEILEVGFSNGDYQVDITELESVRQLFTQIGPFDALIATTGAVHFGALEEITLEQWQLGLHDKLMGQVNLVTAGLAHINDGGSFTLTSGIISTDPIRFGTAAAMVNRALEGFVASAAQELPRGIRINVVSPTILQESAEAFGPFFAGFDPVPAAKVALGYVKSVEGLKTGETLEIKGAI